MYAVLESIAAKYNVGVDAISLRYCMEVFPRAIVLSGANNSMHLVANLKANQFSLIRSEIEQLKEFGISSNKYWQERKQLIWN